MRWLMAIAMVAAVASSAFSQQAPDPWEKGYPHKNVEHDRFDREKWQEVSRQLDYTEGDEGHGAETDVEDNDDTKGGGEDTESTPGFSNIHIPGAEYLMYGLGILGIAVLLYFLVFKNLNRSGKKVRKRKNTLQEVEEDLEGSNVDPLLAHAIDNGNYRLATRLYYLKCIQELSSGQFVHWQRDKTNGEYLQELRDPALRPEFRYLTRQFEQIWYGEREVDSARFRLLEKRFRTFLTSVQNHKNRAA